MTLQYLGFLSYGWVSKLAQLNLTVEDFIYICGDFFFLVECSFKVVHASFQWRKLHF